MSGIISEGLLERLRSGGLRNDFPIFQTAGRDNGLVYLDSGASAQKPQVVIDEIGRAHV